MIGQEAVPPLPPRSQGQRATVLQLAALAGQDIKLATEELLRLSQVSVGGTGS